MHNDNLDKEFIRFEDELITYLLLIHSPAPEETITAMVQELKNKVLNPRPDVKTA